jgi:hypothetical protein
MLCGVATVEYLHVCDTAFMAEGGKHCIIGVFDVINAPAFPATHPFLTVAMRVRGQAHEALSLRVELSRPNGEVLATVPMDLTLNEHGSQFVNLNMFGIQFPAAGRYTVKASEGRQTLVSHSLIVQQAQAPTDPQGGPAPHIRH